MVAMSVYFTCMVSDRILILLSGVVVFVNRMAVGFIATYEISAYQQKRVLLCVRIPLRGGAFNATIYGKVCQWSVVFYGYSGFPHQ